MDNGRYAMGRPVGYGGMGRPAGYWIMDNGQWREGEINVLQHIKKNK